MKRRVWKLVLCLALVMISVLGSTSALAAKTQTVMILKVNTDGARVRSGSDTGNQVITSLKKNTKVFYMGGTDGAYCLIRTAEGTFGYVYRGFLESYGVVRLDHIFYATEDDVKVYKSPSTSSSRAFKLSEGECIIVFAVRGDWAYIKRIDGSGGFVPTSKLHSVY